MKESVFAFIFLLFFSCEKSDFTIQKNSGNISFAINYGGSRNDVAKSVTKTFDGGFAVLGYTHSTDGDLEKKNNDSFDYWVLKFDANTDLIWSKTYGGSKDDRGYDIIETSDNGLAILGFSESTDENISKNNGLKDFWLAKLDKDGSLLWQKNFGFSGNDSGVALTETQDNNLLLSGLLDVTASNGQGNTKKTALKHAGGDYWVLKISNLGELIWSKYFGGSLTDTPFGILETDSQSSITVGSSDSDDVDIKNNKGSYDFWIIKLDENGKLLWENSYGGSEIDQAKAIAKNNLNYLIVGDTRSTDKDILSNYGGADIWIININENGELLWEKNIGGSDFDIANCIKKSIEGGFILGGSSRSSNGDISKNKGLNDALVLKIDEDGILEWELTAGGSALDFINDVVQLENGTIIAVGETNSTDGDLKSNAGFSDLLILKID